MDLQGIRKFQLRQHFTVLINRYEYLALVEGQEPTVIGFAEQKRFKIKEEITFWESESRSSILFSLKAEKALDLHGKFFVLDGEGNSLGYLKKDFRSSLTRSTWEVFDATGTKLFTATEKDVLVALLRRVAAFIPIVGDFIQLIPFHFTFLKDNLPVGTFERKIKLRDIYLLNVSPELDSVDRRLILALGVALDALQDR
jgi:uncharacterized protein YxjI